MYKMYVLFRCKYQKVYIDYTSNLEQRMLSHNSLGKKGYTMKYRPWMILFTEQYRDKKDAIKREKKLNQSPGILFTDQFDGFYYDVVAPKGFS